jgi:hypothetical protein
MTPNAEKATYARRILKHYFREALGADRWDSDNDGEIDAAIDDLLEASANGLPKRRIYHPARFLPSVSAECYTYPSPTRDDAACQCDCHPLPNDGSGSALSDVLEEEDL